MKPFYSNYYNEKPYTFLSKNRKFETSSFLLFFMIWKISMLKSYNQTHKDIHHI